MTTEAPPAGRAGGAKTTREPVNLDHTSSALAREELAQLRRRREASRRLPVLDDGTGDPLDRLGRVPRSEASTIAARRTWLYLRDHDLLDGDEWLTNLLAGVAA